jgi:hypothetical protein
MRTPLESFSKRIIQQSRSNLTKAKKNVSGSLYSSLSYKLKESKSNNSFYLEFFQEDYGKFVDQGVQGKTSSAKAPKSPFRFGSGSGKKGGLTNGIETWVKARRFQFQDRKTKKFLSYKQTAFLIIRSIWHKGIAPTNFFSKPFENEFKKLPDELVKRYGLEIDKFFKFVT